MKAEEVIDLISKAQTAEEVNALIADDETRKTVLAAAEQRLEELADTENAEKVEDVTEAAEQAEETEQEEQQPTPEGMVKVRFLKSPTGAFALGYSAGDEAELPALQAAEVIEAKYAEKV